MQEGQPPLPPPILPLPSLSPPPPLPSSGLVLDAAAEGCPAWWYWQAYRTWVPYTKEDNELIEQGWRSFNQQQCMVSKEEPEDRMGTVSNPILIQAGKRQVEFNFHRESQNGRQLNVGFRHLHREIQRLPLLTEAERENPEKVLRHMSFARLQHLDRSSGHGSRITQEEVSMGKIDEDYSLQSMERTIETQLAAITPSSSSSSHWILGWERRQPL